MGFFRKPLTPSLLEFARHFFQWVLLQVFNPENIIILSLVMGIVIPTLTNTTYITKKIAPKL